MDLCSSRRGGVRVPSFGRALGFSILFLESQLACYEFSEHASQTPTMPQPSTHFSGVPTEVRFTAEQLKAGQGVTIPIYTFAQLEQCKLNSLRDKARFLVDKIGEDAFPPLPALANELLLWIIEAQIAVVDIVGYVGVTPRHLGVPADFCVNEGPSFFGGDRVLSSSQHNYLAHPGQLSMDKLQPAHRGLSFAQAGQVNRQEASDGFNNSRLRNEHGSFYQQGSFRM